jgi:hypothetical protein
MRFSWVVVLALAACGTDDTMGDDTVDCSMVTGVDTFTVGLEKMGTAGLVDFKLMSVDPAPPARGDNTWIVQINTMSSGVVGAPMEGATIKVTPFMPAHQHGTGVTTEITALADPGQYKLSPVNMWMQGVWEVTIRATAGTTSDSAVYKFCIP